MNGRLSYFITMKAAISSSHDLHTMKTAVKSSHGLTYVNFTIVIGKVFS